MSDAFGERPDSASAQAPASAPPLTVPFSRPDIGQEEIEAQDQFFSVLEGGVVCPLHARGGGYGEPIQSGLQLNDNATILQGAIPAAILALLVQAAFTGLDRIVVPRGLRLQSAQKR